MKVIKTGKTSRKKMKRNGMEGSGGEGRGGKMRNKFKVVLRLAKTLIAFADFITADCSETLKKVSD